MYKKTTALKKILKLRKKIRAVAGGMSASKTISILMWLIDYAGCHDNHIISVVSQSFPHLAYGAIRDFKAIMKDANYWDDNAWHESPSFYTFPTGTVIEFFSSDSDKAHGPRRDILFINEARLVSYEEADHLIVRTRKVVWLDWNPTNEFWYYTDIAQRDDVDFLTLTYKDNEALDPKEIADIESRKDRKGWWQVYGLGQLGEIEGIIYTGWKTIKEIPFGARLERYGVDFGFTGDPTAIIAIYYYDGGYILDEVAFLKGLDGKQIADILLNQERKALVVADSSDPRLINEIRSYGVNIIGAKKQGKPEDMGNDNSWRRWGISVIQGLNISVTERSVNTIKAYKNYMWATDRLGKLISPNEPDHLWSDAMDAARYGLTSVVPMIQLQEFRDNMPRYVDALERKNPAR